MPARGLALELNPTVAGQTIDQGGDDILALTGNPDAIHSSVGGFCDDPVCDAPAADQTVDAVHGCIETWIAKASLRGKFNLTKKLMAARKL